MRAYLEGRIETVMIEFLPRDAMHSAEYAVAQDVGLSVCLSHAGILSKRLNAFSNFFHCRVATPF